MIRKSCTCPQKLMEANNYIRNNVPQSTISKICYKLNIYTKCLPKTYLMLSPKPKDKKRCRKFVGLFRRNSNVGNLEPRMPQLRRQSLKLF
uniref:HTH_Tnp_Tc3_1 domain-containing protein n=1 Tax=Strongyloides papillosus TaxID=174720 RepID=A0A0N5BPW3_STREA